MVVVSLSLLIGLGITYQYFHQMLKEQTITDAKIKLSQSARLLEYLSDDMLKLAFSMVADESVTDFILKSKYASVAEEVNAIHHEVSLLQKYISMRENIHSIALVCSDGSVIWDKAPYDTYFYNIMEQSWYTDTLQTEERFYFTKPHEVSTLYLNEEVISLIAQIVNPSAPSQNAGKIIINIRLQGLLDYIKEDAGYFDDFAWMTAGGAEIYWPKGRMEGYMDKEKIKNISDSAQENIMKIDKGYLLTETFTSNDWVLSAFISEKYISQKLRHIPVLFIIIGLLCIGANIVFMQPIVLKITRPVDELVVLMEKAGEGNLNVQSHIRTNDEMEILGEGFNAMMNQLNEYLTLQVEHERRIREQEYDLILARLNPHFVYNTLNTVVYLAKRDGCEEGAAVAGSLICLMQDVIQISDRSVLATLEHEITTIRHYVNIQEFRYPGKFTVKFQIPHELNAAIIPKTVLQPLVENALVHGIFPSNRSGTITINAFLKEEQVLIIQVIDDGIGANQESVERTIKEKSKENDSARHIGLNSIVERLKFMYGNFYGITFHSEIDKGTCVDVRLPYQK